jgi:gas vesicle protein
MAILDYVSENLVDKITHKVDKFTDNYFKPKKTMNSTEKVILGFLAGAAVGAIAGLLLAPATGEETREKIRDGALKVTDDLKKQAQKAWDNFETMKEDGENMVNRQANQVKNKVDQM